MARQVGWIGMRLLIVFLLALTSAFCQTRNVWKSAEIEARVAKTRGTAALDAGAGYSIQLNALKKVARSAGESADQILWIRRGAGRLLVGSPARRSDVAVGDLVRIARGTMYAIEPVDGPLEFVAVRIAALAAGRAEPAGIRPARGEMGDVVKKSDIDATIARTQANAPLHSQDNFTVNYVLFKGRVGPWEAHAGCADIYLLRTGTGVIQLGGWIENAKEESPGEPRGTAMKGSVETAVGPGDLVVIPRNMAHHMNPQGLPLVYVLIKVWSE